MKWRMEESPEKRTSHQSIFQTRSGKYFFCRAIAPFQKLFVYALSAFAFVVAVYLAYAMISTLGTTVWLMIVGAIVLFVIYILIRISYLKKQRRDLITELKQPYEPWEARERECKKMDEAK